jgi:Coenzyme PQQ synthesis protein D (PqqD)
MEDQKMPETAAESHPLLRATVRVPDSVVFRDFPSETVVLNLDTGKYHGLNPTAGEMLSVLEEVGSVEQAAGVIAERHGVELARVQADMCALCEQLDERGLITVEHGESA